MLEKDQPLEQVETFTYLGSVGSGQDVGASCREAQAVF